MIDEARIRSIVHSCVVATVATARVGPSRPVDPVPEPEVAPTIDALRLGIHEWIHGLNAEILAAIRSELLQWLRRQYREVDENGSTWSLDRSDLIDVTVGAFASDVGSAFDAALDWLEDGVDSALMRRVAEAGVDLPWFASALFEAVGGAAALLSRQIEAEQGLPWFVAVGLLRP